MPALVAPGGALVYSVCSIAPVEGDRVIAGFLRNHAGFRIDRSPLDAAIFRDLLDPDGILRTRPDRGGLDGFFAARLVRN